MRGALTEVEKELIYERKNQGETLAQIAKDLGCSHQTARKWWRHKRDGKEQTKRGRPKEGTLSTYSSEIRTTAIALKQRYPSRGAARLRLDLSSELGVDETELPSRSSLAKLFRQECPEAVKTYAERTYPSKPPLKPSRVHQVWQVDGKECVPYGDDEVATVLNIRDPYIGTLIASQAFHTTTELHCRKLTLAEVQEVFRTSFQQWGMPDIIQTDNENVYVGSPERYFPSPFTLWLVGLGISHQPSRKGRPTDQGSVERGHRTQANWCWADETFDELDALQNMLTTHQQLYNHSYPAEAGQCDGQAPLVAFPEAVHSGRPFDPALEWELFQLQRVDQFLAAQTWTRRIDSNGVVRIAGKRYYISRDFRQSDISVQFSASTRSFRFTHHDGSLICEKPARGFDKSETIGRSADDPEWPPLNTPFQLPLPLL